MTTEDNACVLDAKSSPNLTAYEEEKYQNFVVFVKGLVSKNKKLESMIPCDAPYTVFRLGFRLEFGEAIAYAKKGMKLERDIAVRTEMAKLIEMYDIDTNFTTDDEYTKLCRYMSLFAELA